MSRIVFGLHPIRELLKRDASRIQALWVAQARADVLLDGKALGPIPAQMAVHRVPQEQLDALGGEHSHQGVAAVVGDYQYANFYDLFPEEGGPAPLLLVVDGVTDPQNLGAMLRSAVALGATGVVLTKDRCAQITPTVVRISSGASEHVRCARVTNLARALRELKDAGVWIVGTVESGGQKPGDLDMVTPVALVLGSEHAGMRPLVRKQCDLLATIPTPGVIKALNVAAATTAVFYEAARQRS
ncbi:MAG: 23S rRNA (guanosine(2251)-2'-O)-methyltransferase RlmB [Deltaproteobacteria bacterium]|nr:23S rRNA (guanosine(2251)-2'-O)-methyltransferase RlmB [Deltaproteobacteria bacterium]